MRCFLDGLRISQIASKFSRSIKTISGQKQAAFRKLGIRTDAELFKVQRKLDLHIASREPAEDAFHDEASEPTLPPTRSTI
ncbi:hypothetical protein PEQA60_31250 [Pseudomonas sp. Eqa60]|uniref:hypothetical protein n=1 Tax=Pseudomonas sp. Eqa60 TaxID=2799184 RepID=UPI001BF0D430|nr:hypothetical protein [Pseudomonas sp. Eqa60]BCQ69135.1 hypothetical protein PEQA60_31250 [Pseudomonas sp. Eqa60]